MLIVNVANAIDVIYLVLTVVVSNQQQKRDEVKIKINKQASERAKQIKQTQNIVHSIGISAGCVLRMCRRSHEQQ